MSSGYIYILTNYTMPGRVKIGKTTRSPEERCAEINSGVGTGGVPAWHLQHSVEVLHDLDELERSIHSELAETRVTGREIFSCSVARAIAVVDSFGPSKEVDRGPIKPSSVLKRARAEAAQNTEEFRQLEHDTIKQAKADAADTFHLDADERASLLSETLAIFRAQITDAGKYFEIYIKHYEQEVRSNLRARRIDKIREQAEALAESTHALTDENRESLFLLHQKALRSFEWTTEEDLVLFSSTFKKSVELRQSR